MKINQLVWFTDNIRSSELLKGHIVEIKKEKICVKRLHERDNHIYTFYKESDSDSYKSCSLGKIYDCKSKFLAERQITSNITVLKDFFERQDNISMLNLSQTKSIINVIEKKKSLLENVDSWVQRGYLIDYHIIDQLNTQPVTDIKVAEMYPFYAYRFGISVYTPNEGVKNIWTGNVNSIEAGYEDALDWLSNCVKNI